MHRLILTVDRRGLRTSAKDRGDDGLGGPPGPASVTRGINLPIDEGLAIEASYFARMVPNRGIAEGIRAWLEKRAPAFSGT